MVFGGLIGSPQDTQRSSSQLVQCLNMPYKAQDTHLRKKTVEMSWHRGGALALAAPVLESTSWQASHEPRPRYISRLYYLRSFESLP